MKKSVGEYASSINQKLGAINEPVFETAKECADANRTLQAAAEKEELYAKLKIDQSIFSRYVTIGNNTFIRKYLASLPLFFTTLYHVACMTEDELKAGIAEGAINPSATRLAVQNWMSVRKGTGQVANDNQKVYRVIYPDDYTAEDKEKLDSDFREFLAVHHCGLRGAESHAAAATEKARLEYVRSNTRSQVTADRLRRKQEKRLQPKAQRTDAWPFRAEQIKIKSDATADDCQRVLILIGCDDAYAKIIADADRLFGAIDKRQPTPPKKSAIKKKAA